MTSPFAKTDLSNVSSRFRTLGIGNPLVVVMAKAANVIRRHLVDYLQPLALVSARDCHFFVRWFAQILADRTNIFLRGSG
jgi:hypothetical protein